MVSILLRRMTNDDSAPSPLPSFTISTILELPGASQLAGTCRVEFAVAVNRRAID